MTGKEITLTSRDGSFAGYLATPVSGTGPGIVIIQEIFGINPWVMSVAHWYAGQGYMALAPDLFWRLKPGVQLDATKDADFKQGIDYMNAFDFGKGIADIQTAITTLRKLPGCTGKVGDLGFCMGGALAYLTAANTDTDATASYYGGGINTMLDQVSKIKKPTILHFAGSDEFMPEDAKAQINAAVKNNPQVKTYNYPGTTHGFCRATDPRHFNAEACTLAHNRTLELFKTALA